MVLEHRFSALTEIDRLDRLADLLRLARLDEAGARDGGTEVDLDDVVHEEAALARRPGVEVATAAIRPVRVLATAGF